MVVSEHLSAINIMNQRACHRNWTINNFACLVGKCENNGLGEFIFSSFLTGTRANLVAGFGVLRNIEGEFCLARCVNAIVLSFL